MWQLGTLVFRRIFENTAEIGAEKLHANWKGPYAITKAKDSRAWNVSNLKQYYQ